jgi:molybdate transport system permease protein
MPSPAELDILWLSIEVSVGALIFSAPLAVAVAWALSRPPFPGKFLLDAVAHLPIVLPPVLVGFLLLLTLGRRSLIGGWLEEAFGVRLAFSTTGASIAVAVMTFPLIVRAVRLSFEAADRGLDEAASVLGAGPLDRFFSVSLPLAAPGILAGCVTALVAGMGEFGAVITFAASIPGETRTLPLAMYAALQSPEGDAVAFRLGMISVAVACVGLMGAELLNRAMRRRLDG